MDFKNDDEPGFPLLTEESLITLIHELRSPHLVFEFGLSALEDQLHNSFYSSTLAMMRRQLKTAERLLSEAAQLVQAAAGQVKVHQVQTDLSQALLDIVHDLSPLFIRSAVVLVTDIEENLEARLDLLHLGQIMHNLLGNAARYTEPGGQVVVRCYAEERDVVVQIEDTGRGIEPEEISRIFEPFFRGRNSCRDQAGLGVGLSVAFRLLRANGGSISAASRGAGQGSTFTVRFARLGCVNA